LAFSVLPALLFLVTYLLDLLGAFDRSSIFGHDGLLGGRCRRWRMEVVDSVVVVELAALDWFTRKQATVPKRSRTQVNFIPMVEK